MPSLGNSSLRLLIVDDHDLFRAGLRALLEDEGFEVGDAADGSDGVRAARRFQPDVVIMDVNMPGMSGIDATPRILEAAPEASVLVLTIAVDEGRIVDAIRAGASGYLLKDAELHDIVDAVRAAASGHSAIAPSAGRALVGALRSRSARPRAEASAGCVELSTRERGLLELVTDGCSNAEIAARLFLSQSTVKSHVSSLLAKLGVENRVQAATYAVRFGLDRGAVVSSAGR